MIEEICEKYNIRNYTINEDGSIDVDDYVNLADRYLTELPLKFNKITYWFSCSNNELTSLEGSPKLVGEGFYCNDNDLTSLEHSPEYVGGSFYCSNNKLTSLEHSPGKVGSDFYCSYNEITDLYSISNEIGGSFYCISNPLSSIISIIDHNIDMDFIQRFNSFKIIKGNEVNLKRLKYIMSMYDIKFNFEYQEKYIKQYYKII